MQKHETVTTGDLLRKLRKEKNLSQIELEALCHLSQGEISKLENGKAQFSDGIVSYLMKGFGYAEEEMRKALGIQPIDTSVVINLFEPGNDETVFLSKCADKMKDANEMERAAIYKLVIERADQYIQRKECAARFFQAGGGVITNFSLKKFAFAA